MRTSENINEIAAALAKAQGNFVDWRATKLGQEGNRKFKYATFDALVAAVKPALNTNEIAIMSGTDEDAERIVLETRLVHSSGQWIAARYPVSKSAAENHKGIGKAITYGRRYTLAALCGIAADEDTDAEGTAEPPPAREPAPPRQAISAATAKAMADRQIEAIGKASSIAALNAAFKACADIRAELHEHARAEHDRLVAAAQAKRDELNAALDADFPGDRPAPNGAALHP